MLNNMKITKVAVIWATIVYLVCVIVAGILPSVYATLAGYLVHFGMVSSSPAMTFSSAIIGLILWDILVFLLVWLFVWLYNKIN